MATILPTGETSFFDGNGNPLAGGTVTFYIPGTTTPKDTWQDADQSVFNSNPVLLDGAGRAIIFGSGSYRQVVNDADGNLIWDQVTAEPNSGNSSSGGTSGGTPNAQTLTAGTFDGSDGATITFTAGVTNTGPMTLSVGGGAPIAVLKNGPSGPIDLAAGDITSGNIYSVAYSATNASFQLLQSIPPVFAIASQAVAEAGTNNTDLMTPLRVKQATMQAQANLASATTTNLGSLSSQVIRITGTTTITSFGTVDAGIRKTIVFAAALTLTNNATSLILPNGGANIVTTANDSCEAISLGSGNWRVVQYQYYSPVSQRDALGVGYYTGSSASLTSYPLSELLFVQSNGTNLARNQSSNVYTKDDDTGAFVLPGGSQGSLLAGLWRSRGQHQGTDGGLFCNMKRTG